MEDYPCAPSITIDECNYIWAYFFSLPGNSGGFIVYLGQELAVAVRDNGKYIYTHNNPYPDNLHILYLVKNSFKCIFVACWLFIIFNLLLPSIHPSPMVIIMKPPGGQNCWPKRHKYEDDVLINMKRF